MRRKRRRRRRSISVVMIKAALVIDVRCNDYAKMFAAFILILTSTPHLVH